MGPGFLRSSINLEKLESYKILETGPHDGRWVRFPFVIGFLRAIVLPKEDVQISLSSRPKDQANMIVVSLGYQNNQSSAIGTVESPYLKIKQTPNVLKRSCNEIWMIWLNGEVYILKAGDRKALLSMKYSPYSIHYVGFKSPHGTAHWFLNENERIISKPGGRFIYHGIRKGYLELAYKGPSDAYIALFFMHGRPSPPMVEVKLGINKNTESTIRMDNNDYNQVFENTPNLLSPDRFTIFCLKWKAGNMTVRKDHPQGPIVIKSTGCVDFVPHYFAVRSGRGIRGKWILGVNNARAIVDSNPEFQAEHVSELD